MQLTMECEGEGTGTASIETRWMTSAHLGAQGLPDVDCGHAHAARGTQHQQLLARLTQEQQDV